MDMYILRGSKVNIGKDSNAGRDWGQEEKGTTEDEMAGWHHWIDGRKSEWTPGVGDGQGGLACCGSWGRKESDTTERLNWTELKVKHSRKSTGFIYRQTYLNASHKLLWAILNSTCSRNLINDRCIQIWQQRIKFIVLLSQLLYPGTKTLSLWRGEHSFLKKLIN